MTELQLLRNKIKTMMSKQRLECPKCRKMMLVYNELQIIQCARCNLDLRVYKKIVDDRNFDLIENDTNTARLNRVYREIEKFRLMHDFEQEKIIGG